MRILLTRIVGPFRIFTVQCTPEAFRVLGLYAKRTYSASEECTARVIFEYPNVLKEWNFVISRQIFLPKPKSPGWDGTLAFYIWTEGNIMERVSLSAEKAWSCQNIKFMLLSVRLTLQEYVRIKIPYVWFSLTAQLWSFSN